jgi:hypothetical protein
MNEKKELVLTEKEIAEIQNFVKEQISKFGIHIKLPEKTVIIYLFNIISMEFIFGKKGSGYKPSFTIVIHTNGIRYFVFFNIYKENEKLLVEATNYAIQ